MSKAAVKRTEAEILGMLRDRYTEKLLVARGKRLVCATEARPLSPGPAPIARGFLASLLRSACRVSEAEAQRVAAYVDGRLKAYATGEHFL